MTGRKTILVVEDNELNRLMLCSILNEKYYVLQAENGKIALDILEGNKDKISLILLDIVMPVMDGYTFLSAVKANPDYSSIPVIVTTQSGGESDEVAALSHGATDFVAKPYKPQIILHRVASIISLRESAAMLNQFQYDRLTGLCSKEFFYRCARDMLDQNPHTDYDILCSDIENFKLINDVFGIPAGDRLLCAMAELYRGLAGERGICGRISADQFVCLIKRDLPYTNELFLHAADQLHTRSNVQNVVVKWGIYSVADRRISIEQMCDRALLAARSIKGQYGKHFAYYDDTLRNKLLREQAITDEMETALSQNQFEIYLQPKYRIKDNRLVGAEALVRWKHPEWGIQSPGEFIPLFEKNGFITKLDQFVWDRACAILRDWDNKGCEPISVSVNVSRADIYNADLSEILIQIVQKYRLPPSRLHLEITEGAYTENPDQIVDTVSRLRDLGFVIEMDDFGSGYSSLNMLNRMSLDILKLDMKFIQSETAKPVNQGILRFIMGLARWMNLGVVAEGVETLEQLERLREIGCDFVQGYYFSKPLPQKEFEQLFSSCTPLVSLEAPKNARSSAQPAKYLLVADEDAGYRELVRRTFAGRYQILEASDGKAALAVLESCEHRIAAVILSLTLSRPSGFAVLEVLRREKAVWGIPVITTAPPDERLEAMALELDADDFICKPHYQKSLAKRVQRAIEITASREQQRMLRDDSCRDHLTGLLNRRGLDAAAGALCAGDAPLAVYLFNLENLKSINQAYGRLEGDRLLIQFGMHLRAHTRESDILSRVGADEFIVVMKHMRTAESAQQKGEEICREIRQENALQKIPAIISAGAVLWDSQEAVEGVYRRAQRALKYAKEKKKGGCWLLKG